MTTLSETRVFDSSLALLCNLLMSDLGLKIKHAVVAEEETAFDGARCRIRNFSKLLAERQSANTKYISLNNPLIRLLQSEDFASICLCKYNHNTKQYQSCAAVVVNGLLKCGDEERSPNPTSHARKLGAAYFNYSAKEYSASRTPNMCQFLTGVTADARFADYQFEHCEEHLAILAVEIAWDFSPEKKVFGVRFDPEMGSFTLGEEDEVLTVSSAIMRQALKTHSTPSKTRELMDKYSGSIVASTRPLLKFKPFYSEHCASCDRYKCSKCAKERAQFRSMKISGEWPSLFVVARQREQVESQAMDLDVQDDSPRVSKPNVENQSHGSVASRTRSKSSAMTPSAKKRSMVNSSPDIERSPKRRRLSDCARDWAPGGGPAPKRSRFDQSRCKSGRGPSGLVSPLPSQRKTSRSQSREPFRFQPQGQQAQRRVQRPRRRNFLPNRMEPRTRGASDYGYRNEVTVRDNAQVREAHAFHRHRDEHQTNYSGCTIYNGPPPRQNSRIPPRHARRHHFEGGRRPPVNRRQFEARGGGRSRRREYVEERDERIGADDLRDDFGYGYGYEDEYEDEEVFEDDDDDMYDEAEYGDRGRYQPRQNDRPVVPQRSGPPPREFGVFQSWENDSDFPQDDDFNAPPPQDFQVEAPSSRLR